MSTFNKWIESNIGLKAFATAGAVVMASYYFYYHYLIPKVEDKVVPYSIPTIDTSSRVGDVHVKKLFIYPIKSCKGVEVKSITMDKYGIVNDRRWLLTHNNRFITQRVYPEMAHITPHITDDGKELVISAPGMDKDLHVPIAINQSGDNKVDVVIWKDTVSAIDCGEEAKQWFTKYFGKEIKLVTIPTDDSYFRRIEKTFIDALKYQDLPEEEKNKLQASFVDGGHIHILSEASISKLNSLIRKNREEKGEKQEADLTYLSFRPNILVENAFADEEDTWDTLSISNVLLKRVEHTPRCKLTTVEPNKGVIDIYGDSEPLRSLKRFRNLNGQPVFGIVCIHEDKNNNGNIISVNDTIKKL